MKRLPSRHRRLDDALADLPLEEPMLLTELDGFLTGILVCPEPIMPGEWMEVVWGADANGVPAFDDPLDVAWFADAVMARHDEIARDLARGKLHPIFDVDERNGDVLWEMWIDGFAEAMALRPESWAVLEQGGTAEAMERLATLMAIAADESALDSVQINAVEESAPAELIAATVALYAARAPTPVAAAPVKAGRNDPCRCGSGRKSKRCCG